VGQHAAAEAVGEAEVQRQVEGGPLSGEVVLELAGGRLQACRGAQQPGADGARKLLQHRVVVLDGVSHPDQALLGCGQQQRPERSVDGAVGDVEDALGLRGSGKPVM